MGIRRLTNSKYPVYCAATLIKTAVLAKGYTNRSREQTRDLEINPHKYPPDC